MRAGIVISLLGGWFVFSLVYQMFMNRLRPSMRRYDIFWVLPAFRFFHERPPYFVLSYRDRFHSGEESSWQDIHFQRPARWYIALWHPHFIPSNTIEVLMGTFADLMSQEKSPSMTHIQQQLPYRMLLRYVARYPSSPSVQARQFRILRGTEHLEDAPDTVIFVSGYHELSEA
jgi:hypothetical protein